MINGLDALLAERNLLQSCPLSALKGTRIGIDLDIYLRSVLNHPASYEPFVAALGGAPLALISHIENDLRSLERSSIKPVFVLSGLPPARRARPSFQQDDAKAQLRAQGWEAYEDGDVATMQDMLSASKSTDISDVVKNVLRAFRHRNVEFIIAPYLASGQLVSLERHPRGYLHSIYGSTSLLLFPRIDRIILSLNLAAGTFSYASKTAVMAELGIRSDEDFLDVGILAGWDNGPTFPPLVDGTLGPSPAASTSRQAATTNQDHKPVNLRQIADMVRQSRSGGLGIVQSFGEHAGVRSKHFQEQFCRSKAIIKCSMVLRAEDGSVVPLPLSSNGALPVVINGVAGANGISNGTSSALAPGDIPNDLHEVFSSRLPSEVFLHISRGLVSANVYSWLTSGYIIVPAPLDNGETLEYRRFVRETLTESPTSPTCVALALACSSLHSYWTSKKVSAVYWWQNTADRAVHHDSKTTQQLVSRVSQWNVPVSFVEEELRNQNSSTIDIALCLAATKTNELGQKTKTPKRPGMGHQLEKKDEIVANVVWRMLELRGFLNHDHLHTPYARALHLALRTSRLNDKVQEPLYLALELVREGALHGNLYTSPGSNGQPGQPRAFSGGPSYEETEEEKRWLLLIMRSMSLLPMQYKPEAWTAPVSRELLVFNSFVKSLGRSMRYLVETIASTMLLRSDARRARDDYLDIALSLPFQSDTNTGLGVVFKCYIEAFIAFHSRPPTEDEMGSADAIESKNSVLEMLDSTFANVRNVKGEIQRGFRYWECLMVAVRQLSETESVAKDVAKDFEAADKWLRPFRIP
ncbi:unnamed protein product [Parajaminaea phylloscopi]